MKTFLLGLSAGGGCIAHCGSLLLPLMLCGRGRRLRLAGAFLLARIAGYAVLALIVSALGTMLRTDGQPLLPLLAEGLLLLSLGLLLIRHALAERPGECGGACGDGSDSFARFRSGGMRFAVQAGLLTGLGLCAPMIGLLAEGIRAGSAAATLVGFAAFFAGTTLVLLPILIGGMAARGRVPRQIGFMTAILAGALYLIQGSALLVTEVIHGLA